MAVEVILLGELNARFVDALAEAVVSSPNRTVAQCVSNSAGALAELRGASGGAAALGALRHRSWDVALYGADHSSQNGGGS
ncbi:hypothetical protein [Oceanicaulis sp.]|uniref:hypothetical protein n=1 Tax=Oceanicaulis sp. TaxID=1924941 RepID=UPI003F71F90E